MSVINTLGEQLMNIDLNQVLNFLLQNEKLLVVATLNVIIVDTLLWLGGFKSSFLRFLVALSIFIATLMKMKLALLLFNLIGLPLMLAVAVGGIFLKIVLLPKKVAKKVIRKRKR